MVREGGRPLGALQLWRSKGESPFTPAEESRLARLEPFVAHALTRRGNPDNVPLVESGQSGLIIADREGQPVHLSPQGRRLLFLMTHPRVAPGDNSDMTAWLRPAVAALSRHLVGIFEKDARAPPPVFRHRNVWGGFIFRAYWLDTADSIPCFIGITVVHEEPLLLRLMRETRNFPLSRRQAEISVLLASGMSCQAIAERLDISRHTVIAHGRSIYDKLDVHNCGELRTRLLREPHPGQAS